MGRDAGASSGAEPRPADEQGQRLLGREPRLGRGGARGHSGGPRGPAPALAEALRGEDAVTGVTGGVSLRPVSARARARRGCAVSRRAPARALSQLFSAR